MDMRETSNLSRIRENVRIGPFVLIFYPPQLLYEGGEPVVLRQQSLRVLCYLAQQSPQPVRKAELLNKVWPDRFVTEDSIYQCVREVRQALGDNHRHHLKTVSKIGYKLLTDPAQPPPRSRLDISPEAGGDGFRGRLAIPSLDSFRQKLAYARSTDGTRIAYASSGNGSPIVRAPTWMTHLELDWRCEPIGSKVRMLSHRAHFVRFDARGTGLSDRTDPGWVDQWVEDLDAVLKAGGLKKPALIGCSGGALTAIQFAAEYPERISCLILFGGFCRGSLHRGTSLKHIEAFSLLIAEGWGQKNAAFRQMMTSSLFPGATRRQMDDFNFLQRESSEAETAAKLIRRIAETNLQHRLTDINVPTLVIHSQNDLRVPLTEAYLMTESITGAELFEYASENHTPLAQEPAFDHVQQSIINFVEKHAVA